MSSLENYNTISVIVAFFRRHWLIISILVVTAVIYAPGIGNGFVNLDDTILVTQNSHVTQPTIANVGYIFTHFDPELYIPLTFVSYQLEAWTLGMGAWHFHLVNILLHLCTVGLVYAIALRFLSDRRFIAAAAAMLFALHPAHTETVLWVSARKDLLCAVFSLASWLAYIRFLDQGKRRTGMWAILFLLLALLSKVTAVTLPVVFLLTAWERRRPIDRQHRWILTGAFIIAFVMGVIALIGKAHVVSGENVGALMLMSARSVAFSLRMLLWPAHRSVTHILHVPLTFLEPVFLLSIALVIMVTVSAWILRKRWPILPFGWGAFLLFLTPTFPLYSHNVEFLAIGSERYLYLASAPLILVFAWLVLRGFDRFREDIPFLAKAGSGLGVAFFILCSWMIVSRIPVFFDSIAFNRAVLAEEPDYAGGTYNLATAELERGNADEAKRLFQRAITLRPSFAEAVIQIGILEANRGRSDESIRRFNEAVSMRPDYFKGSFNLGVAYQRQKRWQEAADAYRKSIERFPDYPVAHENLARVLMELGKKDEAMEELRVLKGLMK